MNFVQAWKSSQESTFTFNQPPPALPPFSDFRSNGDTGTNQAHILWLHCPPLFRSIWAQFRGFVAGGCHRRHRHYYCLLRPAISLGPLSDDFQRKLFMWGWGNDFGFISLFKIMKIDSLVTQFENSFANKQIIDWRNFRQTKLCYNHLGKLVKRNNGPVKVQI